MERDRYKILILGGGSGGISVAARLRRMGFNRDIAIIDAQEFHDYQPYWTLAGVGLVKKESSRRSMESVIPSGVTWIKDRVKTLSPENNEIETLQGRIIGYDVLIVALGLELNFEKIEGARETLGRNGVISVYQYDQLEASRQTIESFKGGTAIFTMPPVPIKCAGAPQKVMYLADSIWRKNGIRSKSKIIFASAGTVIFGIKEFANTLNEVVSRKEIDTQFQTKLLSVNGANKTAIFEKSKDGSVTREELHFDLLHIVPPMSAPAIVRNSPLASDEPSQKGWLAVDPFTLQHSSFPNVFGIGDVTGIPNSKTGAAIRKQAPVVAVNVKKYIQGESNFSLYDGYSSCPLITDIGKVILAEFGYEGKIMPSFPLDPTKERRIYWYLKKDLLPLIYWNGMLKGRL